MNDLIIQGYGAFPFDADQFARDMRCAPCKATGRRGRGKCGACGGSGSANHLDAPRVRFNWGYHDAAFDAKRGNARTVVATGAHTLQTVSMAFSRWYCAGYVAGLRDFAAGTYAGSSSPAWTDWTGHEECSCAA